MLLRAGLDVDDVALIETVTEAGLAGAPVLLGARVASEVSAPVREYNAAQSLRLVPCIEVSLALEVTLGGEMYIGTTPCSLRIICTVIALITRVS